MGKGAVIRRVGVIVIAAGAGSAVYGVAGSEAAYIVRSITRLVLG